MLLPKRFPDTDFFELKDIQEMNTMLAETIKGWKNEGIIEGELNGIEKGRQQEAAKLFLLLLDSKFGAVSQDLQVKIRQSSPDEIEKWTKQIFQAETPEALLNS